MGKYMRKTRLAGEVAVVDISHHHHPPLGVRTRARAALALQRRPPSPDPDCYLHLRSRKLEKHLPPRDPSAGPDPSAQFAPEDCGSGRRSASADVGLEPSFAESVAEVDATERNMRETTPCSLIYRPGTTTTPSSTSQSSGRRREVATCRDAPTSHEIEEFFAHAEELEQRLFVEKYNFDPLNDCPLPGRFEWVRLEYC